jgi:hypothetical protein
MREQINRMRPEELDTLKESFGKIAPKYIRVDLKGFENTRLLSGTLRDTSGKAGYITADMFERVGTINSFLESIKRVFGFGSKDIVEYSKLKPILEGRITQIKLKQTASDSFDDTSPAIDEGKLNKAEIMKSVQTTLSEHLPTVRPKKSDEFIKALERQRHKATGEPTEKEEPTDLKKVSKNLIDVGRNTDELNEAHVTTDELIEICKKKLVDEENTDVNLDEMKNIMTPQDFREFLINLATGRH